MDRKHVLIALFVAASGLLAPTAWSQQKTDGQLAAEIIDSTRLFGLDVKSNRAEDAYGYAKRMAGKGDAPAMACMASMATLPKSGNEVVDTRCALVAMEVCMHKAIGLISQSQDARRQCTVIKELGGPGACQPACTEAAALPVGGTGKVTTRVATYEQLTPFAVSCFNQAQGPEVAMGNTESCGRNIALECLLNASASPRVNAAIRTERQAACRALDAAAPGHACVPCAGGKGPRLDYPPNPKDLDSRHCTAALAKLGACTMSAP